MILVFICLVCYQELPVSLLQLPAGRTLMKEEMKTAAYSDFQHAKPINPTLEIVKTALVGLFELNIAIIQRGILTRNSDRPA